MNRVPNADSKAISDDGKASNWMYVRQSRFLWPPFA
jgi:hypothetical protein